MPFKAFNSQTMLEFFCFSSFSGILFYLVASQTYLYYVTPRMKPYLLFTAFIMGIWALSKLRRLFSSQYKLHSSHCLILMIPVFLLLFPHNTAATSNFSGNFVQRNTLESSAGQELKNELPIPSTSTPSQNYEDIVSVQEQPTVESSSIANDSERLPGLDTANKTITVADDDFSMWLTELSTNKEAYVGYTIVMTGYVFKDPTIFQADEFTPARLMMSCCVADLTPAGITCKYEKASELKEDTWITVEGKILIGQYEYEGQKYDETQIQVTNITPAQQVPGYIYPFY